MAEPARVLIEHILRGAGYLVFVAEDGAAALEVLAAETIDAVLTDMIMPGMSGLELTGHVRERFPDEHLPVLLLTGDGADEVQTTSLDAGADDFLTKPVKKAVLLARLRAALRVREMDARVRRSERAMRRDLEAARDLQERLLPSKGLVLPGVEVDWLHLPCTYVAGDTFNHFQLPDGKVVFYLADVCGHGAAAAMLAFWLVCNLSRDHIDAALLRNPAKLCKTLDGQVAAHGGQRFMTLMYAILDPASGVLRYCLAGHPHPCVVRRSGKVEVLTRGGMALGVCPGFSFDEGNVQLAPGDRFFYFSDGFLEAGEAEGEQFGAGRLRTVLSATRRLPLAKALPAVLATVRKFQGRDDFDDDMSLVGLQWNRKSLNIRSRKLRRPVS